MYQYLDCPIADLPKGARFLIAAMRRWVVAVGLGRCVSAQMVPLFGARQLLAGLQPFLHAMAMINRYGLNNFHFGNPGCNHVHEDEAILLAMMQRLREGDLDRVRAMVGRIVEDEAAQHLIQAFCELDRAMRAAALELMRPEAASGAARKI